MVEEKGQENSRDVQRPRRDGRRKGDALIDVRDKEGVLRYAEESAAWRRRDIRSTCGNVR